MSKRNENFRCQERGIKSIDEIVCLLRRLQTTLSALIGDQKDNVQFIPLGKVKWREGDWELYLIKALGFIRAYSLVWGIWKPNGSDNVNRVVCFQADWEGMNTKNNEHWLENILSHIVHRNRSLLMSTNKEKQYWLSNVNGHSLTRLPHLHLSKIIISV